MKVKFVLQIYFINFILIWKILQKYTEMLLKNTHFEYGN